jgi:hypothetical protein
LPISSGSPIRGIGRVARKASSTAGFADGVSAFTGTLATRIVQLRPRDPESRGIAGRCNGFFETSFMPGRMFTLPADFSVRFIQWLDKRANRRVVRTIRASPADLTGADRAGMLPLPPGPLQLGWRNSIRLGKDYYVRPGTSDDSAGPSAIGRIVDVSADLERVAVRLDGRIVAGHARVWARGRTITDPGHARTARRLREEFRQPRPPDPGNGLARDLADTTSWRIAGLTGSRARASRRRHQGIGSSGAPSPRHRLAAARRLPVASRLESRRQCGISTGPLQARSV